MNRRDSLCTMATCVASPTLLLNMMAPKPRCVPKVDLKRYMGDWFEIGRYPNPWQKEYVAVKNNYRLRKDGKIDFRSVGRKKTFDGTFKQQEATAKVVSGSKSARWKVCFVWPLTAHYWVIELGDNYEYSVVGQPDHKRLWILSREKTMDSDLQKGICERLVGHGYKPERIEWTKHSEDPSVYLKPKQKKRGLLG
ncbi:MAG: lipocalin family protein [Planctomycetota bacterium]|nr:lipocalin family protein [Planctomycetota bacterium]